MAVLFYLHSHSRRHDVILIILYSSVLLDFIGRERAIEMRRCSGCQSRRADERHHWYQSLPVTGHTSNETIPEMSERLKAASDSIV